MPDQDMQSIINNNDKLKKENKKLIAEIKKLIKEKEGLKNRIMKLEEIYDSYVAQDMIWPKET